MNNLPVSSKVSLSILKIISLTYVLFGILIPLGPAAPYSIITPLQIVDLGPFTPMHFTLCGIAIFLGILGAQATDFIKKGNTKGEKIWIFILLLAWSFVVWNFVYFFSNDRTGEYALRLNNYDFVLASGIVWAVAYTILFRISTKYI